MTDPIRSQAPGPDPVPVSGTPADVPSAVPPMGRGALAKGEARLAWSLLLPTILIVSAVVILPLLAIFWISVKPVQLSDLRAPELVLREDLRRIDGAGDAGAWRFRLRNSSPDRALRGVSFTDTVPPGLTLGALPEPCALAGERLTCAFGDVEGGWREQLEIPATATDAFDPAIGVRDTAPETRASASSVLTDGTFTLANFARIFDGREFWDVLYATLFYTIVGTVGAIVDGPLRGAAARQVVQGPGPAAWPLPLSLCRARHRRRLRLDHPLRPLLGQRQRAPASAWASPRVRSTSSASGRSRSSW